jgi:hypothetical protein
MRRSGLTPQYKGLEAPGSHRDKGLIVPACRLKISAAREPAAKPRSAILRTNQVSFPMTAKNPVIAARASAFQMASGSGRGRRTANSGYLIGKNGQLAGTFGRGRLKMPQSLGREADY